MWLVTAACDDNNNNSNHDNEEEKCRFTTINKISSKIGKNAYKQKQTITEQRFRDEKKNTRSLNYARVQQQRGREREDERASGECVQRRKPSWKRNVTIQFECCKENQHGKKCPANVKYGDFLLLFAVV